VKVINLKTKDEIAAIAKVEMDNEVAEEETEEGSENENNPIVAEQIQTEDNQINSGESETDNNEASDETEDNE